MSAVDDLMTQLLACAARGPSPFDPHWVDEARRLMLWAARTIDAAEPAIRAEYERGRSEREQGAEPVAHICILPTPSGPRKYFTKPNDRRGFPVYASPPKRKPPLPEPAGEVWVSMDAHESICLDGFTADQMRAYGEARAAAERERCANVCEEAKWAPLACSSPNSRQHLDYAIAAIKAAPPAVKEG